MNKELHDQKFVPFVTAKVIEFGATPIDCLISLYLESLPKPLITSGDSKYLQLIINEQVKCNHWYLFDEELVALPEDPYHERDDIETQLLSIKRDVQNFLTNAKKAKLSWAEKIYSDDAELYLKKKMNGRDSFHLCLSSVVLSPSVNIRGKGFFKAIAQHLESVAAGGWGRLEFESVQNPKLEKMLIKHGYTPVSEDAYVKSYWKEC